MIDLDHTVSAAREGCPDAFSDLVRATYDDTYSLALRLVGNPEDARDVAQDTYLKAFRGLPGFRGEANVATWLYRITANCTTTHWKTPAHSTTTTRPPTRCIGSRPPMRASI
jgi:RNA polymerase sigma-70 factor, ECF subfamily